MRHGINRLEAYVLAGALTIVACNGTPAGGPNEAVEQTTAALTANKPLARGLVRDGTGAPLARARVDVRAAGSYRIVACTTTASDGTFALDVRAGTYDLTVTPRTGLAPQIFPGELIAKGTQLELIIAAMPTVVTLSGHVTDQNGQPLSVFVCGTPCAPTDGSGAFAVTAVTGQSLEVSGRFASGSFEVRVAFDPAQSAPLQIVIPIFTLSGTALDQSGAPVSNVQVAFPACSQVDVDGLSGDFCIFDLAETDSAGRFHFASLPGDVLIQVPGDRGAYQTTPVVDDSDVVVQSPPSQSLSGRISDRDGNALSGDTLCLMHSGCHSHFCSESCVSIGGDGRYTFSLSEGTYDAELTSPPGSTLPIGYYGLAQTITLTQPTELDLAFANRIVTGSVLNVDGTPASDVPVSESCHDVDVDGFTGRACAGTATTDANGRFQMSLTGPGDVVLTATGATVASVRVTVTNDTDVVIPLSIAQPVIGQIMNGDGNPAAGFSVCYTPAGLLGTLGCTTTDASGAYQLTLSPGPYALSVFGNSAISSVELDESVTVPSTPTLIQLAPTRSVAVRLVNADGTPLTGADVFSICGTVEVAGGGTEQICTSPLASNASGVTTVPALVGSPMELRIQSQPALNSPVVAIDSISMGDGTELTIAIQPPPAAP